MSRVWRAGLVLALLLILVFGVGAPPERCPTVSPAELQRSAQAAVDWFVRNQEPDGDWLYEYDVRDDSVSPEYNEVRHAGVTMGLYQAAAAGLPGALRSADRGTEWALARLEEDDDWAAFSYDGRTTTGATALLVAGLAIRREATGDERYDEELRRLGRFLVAQTEPSGAVLAEYDADSGAAVPDLYSKYYTGEAYWALGLLHRAFPDEGWGRAADRIGAYLATSRDEVEDHWPPIPDHWAAYGQAETVEFPDRGDPPLSDDELDYAREQAGHVRLSGALPRPALRPVGRRRARRIRAARRLVRGRRRGDHGLVADGAGGCQARRPEHAARRARHLRRGLAVDEQSTAADAEGARRRSEWRAPGRRRHDPHGRPAACPRRAAADDPDRAGGGLGAVRQRLAVGLAVGRRAAAGAEPGARRLRRAARRALAARGGRAGGSRRRRGRDRGVRGRPARRPAARRARRERVVLPHRRRHRGGAGRGDRPVPATAVARAGARRLACRARAGRDPAGRPAGPDRPGARRRGGQWRPRGAGGDGPRRRAAHRGCGRLGARRLARPRPPLGGAPARPRAGRARRPARARRVLAV